MTAHVTLAAIATWEKTLWKDENAWVSAQGEVQAIVTEARARLIYLGAADGSCNLLNAPASQVHPSKDNPWPNLGGHRFWLGPQTRWIWPPPAEWEYSGTKDAKTKDGVLTLRHAHINPEYPAIAREYAWEGNRLRCTAYWQDDGQPYFGIHVVAVNTPVETVVRLEKAAFAPAGLVVAQIKDPEGPIRLPHPSITLRDQFATVRSGIKTVKLGFAPQPLTILRPLGWTLSVQPGPWASATNVSPDHGYLSQIWAGDKTHDFNELEQLTPYLKGDASGRCTSTIYLEAIPPRT
jgi:hypothetical protein